MTSLTVPPNTLQASIAAALTGPNPECALEQAFIQLSRGGDLALLLAMVKAFVRVGLAGMALRLLHAGGGLITAEPQLAALAEQLAALPTGEVPSQELARRFHANADALVRSHPQLAPHLPSFEQLSATFCVYRSAVGNMFVNRDTSRSGLHLVFPFADHRANTAALAMPQVSLGTSFLMVGVPSAPLWERVLGLRLDNGYVPPIDVVETDADVLGIWLAMIEPADILQDDRICIFTGLEAAVQYREFLVHHAWRAPATHVLTNHRPRWQPPIDKAFHDGINAALKKRREEAKRRIERCYAPKDAAHWTRRWNGAGRSGPPLRIAGFTTRFSTVIQHAMRDLGSAFQRRGCNVDIIKQLSASCAVVDVIGALASTEFDLIIVMDHLRSEFADVAPANLPYVCWIQDYMEALWTKNAGRSVGEYDVIVGHSPHVMASLYDYPLDRFISSSNLTDAHTYNADPVPAHELDPYRCDLSFASHGAGTPEQLIDEIAAGSIPHFRRLLESFLSMARRKVETCGWINSQELVELMLDAEHDSGHPALSPDVRRSRVYPQLARLYDRMFRHETLQWAANWAASRDRSFRVYGKGWRDHPTLGRFAAGEVQSGHPLRCLYQASAISLQVNGYASLHQRLLDGLASGAFMLCRYNPADFIRQPFLTIQQIINTRQLRNLNELLALRANHAELNQACDAAERLCTIRIASITDPARQEYMTALQQGNPIEQLLTDEGLFDVLANALLIPSRTAGELPGFEQIAFRTETQLHDLLDQYVDDREKRQVIAQPMRQSVIEHDTFDVLADRILATFADRLNVIAGNSTAIPAGGASCAGCS